MNFLCKINVIHRTGDKRFFFDKFESENLGSLPCLPEAGLLLECARATHMALRCIGIRLTIRLKFFVLSTSEAKP